MYDTPEQPPVKRIESFDGDYGWLSNFFPLPVEYMGIQFPTVENAYQAAKCPETEMMQSFVGVTPGKAKRKGAQLEKAGLARKDWGTAKFQVMEQLVRQKFQNQQLRLKLLGTGDVEIVEGNTWGDVTWGMSGGKGENRLGKLLMKIRSEIQQSMPTRSDEPQSQVKPSVQTVPSDNQLGKSEEQKSRGQNLAGVATLVKTAESYTSYLIKQLKEKLGLDVRFSMFHASGSSVFVFWQNDLYEVRVEAGTGNGKGGSGDALSLLTAIENSGLFDNVKQIGSGASFMGTYQPDFGTQLAYPPSRQPYTITVVHWKSSPYGSYFEQTKLRDATENKQPPKKEAQNWYKQNVKKFGPLGQTLLSLRGQLASAAQGIYDSWTQDADGFDDELGGGGICDEISQAMSGIIATIPDADITEGGQDGDDHAYLIVYSATEAYEVDIPPSVYETGGGYSWQKVEGVQFTPDVVMISPLNRADFPHL